MIKLQKGSATNSTVPKGCKYCALGGKLVLLVTGLCSLNCFYCPLSEEKKNRDVIYADEMPVKSDDDIIYEAKMIDALGTGITGGDPIIKIDRTVHYIELLKNNFGEKHHIHLYTATGNKNAYRILKDAGLDEIRIHVPEEYWDRMPGSIYEKRLNDAIESGLHVGIEIPVLPRKENEILKLIKFADDMNIEFINLNELEFSETNWMNLRLRNYRVKSDISSAVWGSETTAYRIIERSDTGMIVHYCSSRFKDGVQMKNRLKRRAKNVAKPYEIITSEGTLLRGEIVTENVDDLFNLLIKEKGIDKELVEIKNDRIYIAPWIIEDLDGIDGKLYIVEEYPTWDRLEVERTEIKNKSFK